MNGSRLTIAAGALCFAMLACGGQPTAFPTAGVTVQAFPNVEIILPSDTPPPPSATLPPSDTPHPTEAALPTDTPAPTLTATALIQLAPPTSTPAFIRPTQPKASPVPPTATAPPAAAAPIRFRRVSFVSARLDPARPPDGSFTTLSVEFTGSRPPFTVQHDNLVGNPNPNGDGTFNDAGVIYTFIHFTILKTCGGVVGTVTVTGGDGQTFTSPYFVEQAPCS